MKNVCKINFLFIENQKKKIKKKVFLFLFIYFVIFPLYLIFIQLGKRDVSSIEINKKKNLLIFKMFLAKDIIY